MGDLKSHFYSFTIEIEIEFALLDFGLALVQCFLTIPFFLPFIIIMYILCYCELEVCSLLLILLEITVKRLA